MKRISRAFLTILLVFCAVVMAAYALRQQNASDGLQVLSQKIGEQISGLVSSAQALTGRLQSAGAEQITEKVAQKTAKAGAADSGVQKSSGSDGAGVLQANPTETYWGDTGMQGVAVYEYGKTLLRPIEQACYDQIAQAVGDVEPKLVIKTDLTPADFDKVYEYFLYDHAEIFYLRSADRQYSYAGFGKDVSYKSYTLSFDYTYGRATVERMRGEMGESARGLLAAADGMTGELEKERALHDALVRHCQYDLAAAERVTEDPGSTSPSFTAYGALVRGSAVCDGYARAMKMLLGSVHIESLYVTGTAKSGGDWERHGWNMAQIDGRWYFLDATFDDPVLMDQKGDVLPSPRKKVSHRYFNFISRSDHRLGAFNPQDPFSENSENYAVLPKTE